MISAVSNVNFKGTDAQALFESPGKFTKQPSVNSETPADEFVKPKKKHKFLKALGIIAGAAVVVLGGSWGISKLVKVKPEATNFLRKGLNKIVEFGQKVGEKAAGILKRGKNVADVAEDMIEK